MRRPLNGWALPLDDDVGNDEVYTVPIVYTDGGWEDFKQVSDDCLDFRAKDCLKQLYGGVTTPDTTDVVVLVFYQYAMIYLPISIFVTYYNS